MANNAVLIPRIIVLCGVGGVGKTSLSAAMGLAGALSGLKTITFTIDPARRLADALGVNLSGSTPQPITLPGYESRHKQLFSALMLDQKTVAADLVNRYSRTKKDAEKITRNPLFELGKKQLSGAEEYLALGKLYQLITDEAADLIVVDTAPDEHTLEFFRGPGQLLKILEPEAMNRIKAPIQRFRQSRRISGFTPGAVLAKMAMKVAGADTVNSFMNLTGDMGDMYEAFKERVQHLTQILRNPTITSVYLVTTPDSSALTETTRLITQLAQQQIPIKGVLFNKVTPPLVMIRNQSRQIENHDVHNIPTDIIINDALKKELKQYLHRYDQVVRQETRMMTQCLLSDSKALQNYRIPLLARDVSCLRDIDALHPYLTGCIDDLKCPSPSWR